MTLAVLAIVAPVACGLIWLGVWYQRGADRLQETIRQRQQQRRAANRAAEPADRPNEVRYWFRVFHPREPVIAQPEPTEGQHRQREEEFWRCAIRKQRNLNRLTFIGAAAAIAAFAVLWLQLRDTRSQLEVSERPWLSVDPIRFSNLSFDKNGGHFAVKFLITNVGHSPATHVQLEVKLIATTFNESGVFKEPAAEQKRLCDDARTPKRELSDFLAFVLFPEQKTTRDVGMSISPADITHAESLLQGAVRPSIFLTVAGCVDYQFAFEAGHHQTGFLYTLSRRGPENASSLVYVGDTLKPENLLFDPYAFGNVFYAD